MTPSNESKSIFLYRKGLRTLSFLSCGCLVLLSIIGFHKLASITVMNMDQVEATTSDGCLLFLGVTFGTLLFMGEFRWERFFFLFGFLRYRLGRMILYVVSGIMTILVGRTKSNCSGCEEYNLLIAEGISLLITGVLQLVAIVVLGTNNTAPVEMVPIKPQLTSQSTEKTIDARPIRLNSTREVPPVAAVETRSPFETTSSPPKAPSPSHSNLPSWMHA
ncbi:hypothetical protein THRCLA_20871 [Thraustotheca clavata]|uniref:Uncharacterized protein n=1 Tax=Thraustotheca clavata TaxID=74557 RepID=A0A1W0A2I0_9STRA|nr:hypothetical protein THRCLA_20871 [Thraustotheca clavata]